MLYLLIKRARTPYREFLANFPRIPREKGASKPRETCEKADFTTNELHARRPETAIPFRSSTSNNERELIPVISPGMRYADSYNTFSSTLSFPHWFPSQQRKHSFTLPLILDGLVGFGGTLPIQVSMHAASLMPTRDPRDWCLLASQSCWHELVCPTQTIDSLLPDTAPLLVKIIAHRH